MLITDAAINPEIPTSRQKRVSKNTFRQGWGREKGRLLTVDTSESPEGAQGATAGKEVPGGRADQTFDGTDQEDHADHTVGEG